MARRSIVTLLAGLTVVLVSCQPGPTATSSSIASDQTGTIVDVHGDPEPPVGPEGHTDEYPEGWMAALLSVDADAASVGELQTALQNASDGVEANFEPGWLDLEFDPQHIERINECPSFGLPILGVSFDPDMANAEGLIDILESSALVVGINAPGFETTKPLGSEEGYDEVAIACDQRIVLLYVNREEILDIEVFRSKILAVAGVIAVGYDRFADEMFIPDTSRYTSLEACYAGANPSLWVIFDDTAPATLDSFIGDFEDVSGVIGFGGAAVDPTLAPTPEHSGEEYDWSLCEGIEGQVRLAPDIADEDAALVVARALAIDGIADVHLSLVDPEEAPPCPDSGDDEVHVDCFQPSSELTLYRGDPGLATPEVVAAALCGLPGVLSINVYDREGEQEFADPYTNCGELRLDVILEKGISFEEADHLANTLGTTPGVADHHGPWFADYDVLEQTVVFGELDEQVCLNVLETNPRINLVLERMEPAEARKLANFIVGYSGVVDVQGNAVGRQTGDPNVCGYGGMWVRVLAEMADPDRSALLRLFAGRTDILAVVIEEPNDPGEGDIGGGELGQGIAVLFALDEPPADLEDLAAQIRSLSGVQVVEINDWVWKELSP